MSGKLQRLEEKCISFSVVFLQWHVILKFLLHFERDLFICRIVKKYTCTLQILYCNICDRYIKYWSTGSVVFRVGHLHTLITMQIDPVVWGKKMLEHTFLLTFENLIHLKWLFLWIIIYNICTGTHVCYL